MELIYNIPESIDELFERGEDTYYIQDYTIEPMDNNESMAFFLDRLGIPESNIDLNDGTKVILKHDNYPQFRLIIDAGGFGDFYSHKFDVIII